MELAVTLAVQEGEAVRAKQSLFLLVKNSSPDDAAVLAHRGQTDFRKRVLAPVPVEVVVPQARAAEVITAEVGAEGRLPVADHARRVTFYARCDNF